MNKSTRIRELQILIAGGLVPPEMFSELLELLEGEVRELPIPSRDKPECNKENKMSKNTFDLTPVNYDLKMRLACRLASQVTDKLRYPHNPFHRYSDDQLNLIFDALANGLGGKSEDDLLTLIGGEDHE